MDTLRAYIFSILGAALINAVAMRILSEKKQQALVQVVCGLFLAFTILRPVTGDLWSGSLSFSADFSQAAQEAAQEGTARSQAALRDRIKAQCEAYILEKAEDLGASIQVQVQLSQDPIPAPEAVELEGEISPYAKRILSDTICQDLGIGKEAQSWR